MQNWNLLVRRTHLYLGMLLVPWVVIYALSTVTLNHAETFRPYRNEARLWEKVWEKDYAVDVPNGPKEQGALAAKILATEGIDARFVANRQGRQFNINLPKFRQPRRLIYDLGEKKLRMERRVPSVVETLVRLHERTGYGRGGFLDNLWAFAVDVFCVTTFAWIATGLYLWWKLEQTRRWGFLALGGGIATIIILLCTV